MALDNLQIDYLIDPAFQIENLAGKPAVGGHIEVFEAGTDTKVITYQDFDGNVNPFKIPLHSDGRAVILADPSRKYDFYVYDSFNNLMFSRLNVTPNLSGNISIKGSDVYIYNTDGTLDITQQSIQNNIRRYEINTKHKSLGVEAPLYFVEDSDSATIIGIKGGASGYVTKDYVDSVVSGKLDTSAFSAVSGDFLTDKFEYDDNFNITGYNGSAFASNGETYSAGANIDITDNVISVTGLPTSSDVENAISSAVTNVENKFEYNENNYITAYNNSAFAGTNYSAGDYVSIENDTISVTGLQPSGDYATKTELESATSGKMDVTGMTAYQPSGDYATHDDLTAYQPAGDYYSASNPSGFITNDAITGLQPSGDYATHDDLTAYATTALVSSVSSELYSAFSGISGDFELVAGSGVELVDDPNAKTTTINVTAEGTPVTAIEQMIESATSGKADTSGVVEYRNKPESGAIYASTNTLYNVNAIGGESINVQSAQLYINGIILATSGGLTANGITANSDNFVAGGITANGALGASGFSSYGISAGKRGPLWIQGETEIMSAYGAGGFTFSSVNTGIGTAMLTTAVPNQIVQMYSPKFEARNVSGAGFSIEASGARGYDASGNVTWDTTVAPTPTQLIAGVDSPKPSILLSHYMPKNMSAQFSNAPLLSADGNGIYIGISGANLKAQMYGITARNGTVRTELADNIGDVKGYSYLTGYDVGVYKSSAYGSANSGTWSLTGSVQKREIECDGPTSAITAIAGSAIGGGVPAGTMNESAFGYDASDNITGYNGSAFKAGDEFPQSATDAIEYVTATSGDINSTIDNVSSNSGAWGGSALPISAGPGIKFEMVDNTLVASTDETVLWEGSANAGLFPISLSEPTTAFKEIKFVWTPRYQGDYGCPTVVEVQNTEPHDGTIKYTLMHAYWNANEPWLGAWYLTPTDNYTKIASERNAFCNMMTSQTAMSNGLNCFMWKVIGINRIAGGN